MPPCSGRRGRGIPGVASHRRVVQIPVDTGALSGLDRLPNSLPDEEITAVVDGRINVPEFAIKHYLLIRCERGPGPGPHRWESNLIAGLGAGG